MKKQDLIVSKEAGVVTIILNRPERMNALTKAMLDEIPLVIESVRQEDEAKVLVITGAGHAFCTGADVEKRLASGATFERLTRRGLADPIGHWMLSLVNLEKPTIAAINGIVAGAGLSLIIACDIRIASENARFSAVWIRRGLVPEGGTTKLLPQIVGISKAYELMYTGDIIDAARAERIGLVNNVVPAEDLMKVTKELATKLAKGPSVAIEFIKRAVRKGLKNDLESQLDFETYAQNIIRQTEDYKEGVNSFLEKREPVFKGR